MLTLNLSPGNATATAIIARPVKKINMKKKLVNYCCRMCYSRQLDINFIWICKQHERIYNQIGTIKN